MAKSRRLDGKPETEADRRFFTERASGYRGPLDQDGRRVTDPATLAIFKSLDEATARAIARGQR